MDRRAPRPDNERVSRPATGGSPLPPEAESGNVAALALRHARATPHRLALAIPTTWGPEGVTSCQRATYSELGQRVQAFSAGLRGSGFRPGDRVVLLFPVSVDLYALALALLASGLAVVMVDAGMGPARILRAIRDSSAVAVVSVSALLKYRFLAPPLWGRRLYAVDSSGLLLRPFEALVGDPACPLQILPRAAEDHALITFTSGSTGRPKGADRTHGLLRAQHYALSASFSDTEGEDVDLPCFPVAALHNLAGGITTVLPAVDFRAPATVEPAVVLKQIAEHAVKRFSGAPAYMERLVAFMERTGERTEGVRRVTVGGAPISSRLCARILRLFPGAACHVLYGSTEAEPMAVVDMAEVVAASGEGYLVGRPAALTDLAVVSLPDPPPALDGRGIAPYRVPRGAEGEVVVHGPHVNRRYVNNPEADREFKLVGPGGDVWHRTRDVGRVDEHGRLWLTGQLGGEVEHRGRVLQPLAFEAVVNAIDGVRRAALVAHRLAPEGELVVEPEPGREPADVIDAVHAFLAARGLPTLAIRTLDRIPVDRRHNSKVDRPALRARPAARRRRGG